MFNEVYNNFKKYFCQSQFPVSRPTQVIVLFKKHRHVDEYYLPRFYIGMQHDLIIDKKNITGHFMRQTPTRLIISLT